MIDPASHLRPLAALGLAAALAACATTAPPSGQGDKVTRAVEQPVRDLSLVRETAAAPLLRAWQGPYRADPGATCADLSKELAELDAALGPDLADAAKPESQFSPTGLAADVVGGAVGLPFRSVVRTVTGAERRDRQTRAAVMAGMVRRGFLKGRMHEMGCAPPPPPSARAPQAAG